jgi:D-alanyl-D-alanine carboxypeptidase
VKESVKTFVQEMNRTAKSLGLKHTRYGNPHGLPSVEARSTAADMARLVSKCLENSLFCEVVATEKYKTKIKGYNGKVKAVEWENTNKLLRRPGFIGVKTGITVTAGPCLAAAYVFREKTYIVILLRTNKISRRFK